MYVCMYVRMYVHIMYVHMYVYNLYLFLTGDKLWCSRALSEGFDSIQILYSWVSDSYIYTMLTPYYHNINTILTPY